MPQGPSISFVTFPDGKVDERSLTVSGERIARERCIRAWLPEQFFGTGLEGYAADSLWRQMAEKGMKSHTIKINESGEPEIDK